MNNKRIEQSCVLLRQMTAGALLFLLIFSTTPSISIAKDAKKPVVNVAARNAAIKKAAATVRANAIKRADIQKKRADLIKANAQKRVAAQKKQTEIVRANAIKRADIQKKQRERAALVRAEAIKRKNSQKKVPPKVVPNTVIPAVTKPRPIKHVVKAVTQPKSKQAAEKQIVTTAKNLPEPVRYNKTPVAFQKIEDTTKSKAFLGNALSALSGSSNNKQKRYIIKYKSGVQKASLDAEIPKSVKRNKLRHFDGEIIMATEAEIEVYKNRNDVEVIDDVLMEPTSIEEYQESWGVERIGARFLHDNNVKGETVKIAIIDTGLDYNHPDFQGIYAGGYDFSDGDNDPMDYGGHGTAVAGIIASQINNLGAVGVAPKVEIYALKAGGANTGGQISSGSTIASLDWALDNGIKISNSSFGSEFSRASLQQVYQRAENEGMVNIASAGNGGNCAGTVTPLSYPAALPSVISVAATDRSDARGCFSRVGSDIDIAAPGVNTLTTKAFTNGYEATSGTSISSPHITGAVALLWNLVRDTNGNGRKNDEMRELLLRTADDIGPAGNDSFYGAGIVNVRRAYGELANLPSLNIKVHEPRLPLAVNRNTPITLSLSIEDEDGDFISNLNNGNIKVKINNNEISYNLTEGRDEYNVTFPAYELNLDPNEKRYPLSIEITTGGETEIIDTNINLKYPPTVSAKR